MKTANLHPYDSRTRNYGTIVSTIFWFFTTKELKNIHKKSISRMSHIFKYVTRLYSENRGFDFCFKNNDAPYIFNLRYFVRYIYVNGYNKVGAAGALMDLDEEHFDSIDLLTLKTDYQIKLNTNTKTQKERYDLSKGITKK